MSPIVNISAELLDQTLEHSEITRLDCDLHRRETSVTCFVDVRMELFDPATSHFDVVSYNRGVQGRYSSVPSFVDVSAEILTKQRTESSLPRVAA
jgi:hypothetical protein